MKVAVIILGFIVVFFVALSVWQQIEIHGLQQNAITQGVAIRQLLQNYRILNGYHMVALQGYFMAGDTTALVEEIKEEITVEFEPIVTTAEQKSE